VLRRLDIGLHTERVSQRTATSSEPLGAQAGEKRLRDLAAGAGFSRVSWLKVHAPMNLVLALRP
jgi:hypothetical protein